MKFASLNEVLPVVKNFLRSMTCRTNADKLERRRTTYEKSIERLRVNARKIQLSCKAEDDAFFEEINKCIEILKENITSIDTTLVGIINTFPVGVPCTMDTIAKRVGARPKTLERLMTPTSMCMERPEDTSRTRIVVLPWQLYAYDAMPDYYYVTTLVLPNWRYVGNYLERVEDECCSEQVIKDNGYQ